MPRNNSLNLVLITAIFGLAACHTNKTPAPVAPQPVVATPAPVAPAIVAPTPVKAVEPAVETKKLTKKEARAAKAAAAEGKVSKPTASTAKIEAAAPVATPAPDVKPVVEAKPAAKTSALGQDQALALAKKGNCLACHKIDSKLVGPAWKDVGVKYKGDAATIAANIKKGGKFGWNMGMMPPKGGSSLSDADITSLAGYIATLK